MYNEKIHNIIDKWFEEHRNEYVELVCRLVGYKSVTGATDDILHDFLKLAENEGFITRNMDNILGIIDFPSDEKNKDRLDILAHLDVVEADEKWMDGCPFEAKVLEGKIIGRGSQDDKGPAVAAYFALRSVKDLQLHLQRGVRLVLGTAEESGRRDLEYYYKNEKEAEFTFSPDADFPLINREHGIISTDFYCKTEKTTDEAQESVISLDVGISDGTVPGNAKIVLAKNGGIRYTVHAEGRSSHACLPERGENAITLLLDKLREIYDRESGKVSFDEVFLRLIKLAVLFPHGDFRGKKAGLYRKDEVGDETCCSLTRLCLKDSVLSGHLDIRIPVNADGNELLEVLKKGLSKAGFEMKDRVPLPGHYVDPSKNGIPEMLSAYEEFSHRKGYARSTTGITYAHDLRRGVAFGALFDGKDNNIHGRDEFTLIDEMITAGKIYASAIVRLCT